MYFKNKNKYRTVKLKKKVWFRFFSKNMYHDVIKSTLTYLSRFKVENFNLSKYFNFFFFQFTSTVTKEKVTKKNRRVYRQFLFHL